MVLNVNFGTQSLRMIIRQRIFPMMHSLMLIITSAGELMTCNQAVIKIVIQEMYTLTQMDLGAIQQIQIKLGKLVFQNYVVQVNYVKKDENGPRQRFDRTLTFGIC